MLKQNFLTNRYMQLAIWVCALALIWLNVLPSLATVEPIASHIQEMEEANINVGAMVYTELDWQPPDGAAFR